MQVVKENEQSEPVQTAGEGLLDKAKAAVGIGQSKQVSCLQNLNRRGTVSGLLPENAKSPLLAAAGAIMIERCILSTYNDF